RRRAVLYPHRALASAQQLHAPIAFEQVEQRAGGLAARAGEAAVALHEQTSVVVRERKQALELLEVGEPERRVAGLARPQQLAAAAQAQVLLGQTEAVLRRAHQRQAIAADFGESLAAKQQADRFLRAATDAAAQ